MSVRALFGGIVLCVMLQLWLAFVVEFNWDEFFHLSHIYDFQRGEMARALQSLHVHLLGWVTAIPGDELGQLRAGRLFMLACFVGTCALIYQLSRAFFQPMAALIAVLVFASAGFSIIHGASFRADPVAALFTMASLVVVARGRLDLKSLIAAAVFGAIAAMITVKVVLYAPAFLGVAAWRVLSADDRKAALLWLAGAGVAAAACFAILYLAQLGLATKATNAASRAGLRNAAETQFSGELLPRAREISRFALLSPIQSILLLSGLGAALAMLRSPRSRPAATALIGCGSTLLCLLFYRNAFPYFFPFILAPAAILAALATEQVQALRNNVTLLAIGLCATAVMTASVWSGRSQVAQGQVIAAVHDMFPEPVHYIDRNSMIASFPQRGFFMSTWGMQNYRRWGMPVFDQVLARDVVPLVITNGPALENAFGGLPGLASEWSLFERDKAALRDNFIPHWGPLWVAGKVVRGQPGGTRFAIAVPGTYTVEGAAAVIDGVPVQEGNVVDLARGEHVMSSRAEPVTLRWGNHLPRPREPSLGPIYRGF